MVRHGRRSLAPLADRRRRRRAASPRRGDAARSPRHARGAHRRGRRRRQRAADAVLRARPRARRRARCAGRSASAGLLAGLPVPIKDLTEVAGVRTTYGSPIFADFVPDRSDILVETLEREGGRRLRQVQHARSSAPAPTPSTRSSGARSTPGTRAARRRARRAARPWRWRPAWPGSRTAPISAARCAIRRASAASSACGRAPAASPPIRHSTSTGGCRVEGPMARTVEDVALFLDALSGDDPRDPVSLPKPATPLPRRCALRLEAAARRLQPRSRHHAGRPGGRRHLPQGGAPLRRGRRRRRGGASRSLRDARHVRGAAGPAASRSPSAEPCSISHRDKLKPEVIWNIERGLALTMTDLSAAERQRAAMLKRALAFFETYDLLLTPATIVPPFPVEQRYRRGARRQDIRQLRRVARHRLRDHACRLPRRCRCRRLHRRGLPVGLQVVAPPRREDRVLAGARLLERHSRSRDLAADRAS